MTNEKMHKFICIQCTCYSFYLIQKIIQSQYLTGICQTLELLMNIILKAFVKTIFFSDLLVPVHVNIQSKYFYGTFSAKSTLIYTYKNYYFTVTYCITEIMLFNFSFPN